LETAVSESLRHAIVSTLIFVIVSACGRDTRPASATAEPATPASSAEKAEEEEKRRAGIKRTVLENAEQALARGDVNGARAVLLRVPWLKDDPEVVAMRVQIDAIEDRRSSAEREKARLEEEKFLRSPAGKICKQHQTWSRDLCKTIADKKVIIGMTAEQVRLAWGEPERINTTTRANFVREQWVYGDGQYVYIENGIFVSLQQSR
jgi:hypothetical protein